MDKAINITNKEKNNFKDFQPVKRIVIIGLPNTGKSQIFNNLTSEYTLVANYPLTTVEIKKTKCQINGETCEIIDTPGLHCLYIHSEEELVVRNMLLSEKPDVIIQCIDANRLKQSLILTADLLELGIPMVISLNAIDETTRRGVWIDSLGLSRILGVPVVESVAINGVGTYDLRDAIGKAKRGKTGVQYGEIIEDGISHIEAKLPQAVSFKRKLSTLLLLNDPFLLSYLKEKYSQNLTGQLKEEVEKVRQRFRGNLSRVINNKRSQWISEIVEETVKKHKISLGGFSQTFARLSRHPVFGLPILFAIVAATFYLVVNVADAIAGWMEGLFWVPVETQINNLVPFGFWNDFLIGDYGVLSLGLANAFITVLPILSVFFLLFNFLEDVGYIPNATVMTRRVLEKIGLSGNAIMPLVLGFGCKTMATLTTKSLKSKKERYIATYLIAFAIPCAAQLAIDMGILGKVGFTAFLISYGTLLLVEMGAGLILNKIIKEDEKSSYIQELPAIRFPNIKAVVIKTYYRLYWFLKEAIPIFMIAAFVLFAMDKTGILEFSKRIMAPVVVGWLGLPIDIVDALILSLARHEAAAALLFKMLDSGALNYIQAIVAVVITTMFVPCFANIVAICKEQGIKAGIIMVTIINISSFVLAGILNWVLVLTIGG